MSDKKYFFFDIDGTLTDHRTHQVVPSAYEAVQKLQANGHFVAVASGRIHYKTKAFTDQIGIHNLVCSGGACLSVNDEVVYHEPLPEKEIREVIANAEERGMGLIFTLDDTDTVWMKDYRFLEQAGFRKELTSYKLDPTLDYHAMPPIYKMYLVIRKDEEEKNPWMEGFTHFRMTKDYIIYQYDKKKDGILAMMDYLGQDVKDVVVFGDEVNDIVMFDPRWFSIAMGNAAEELKEVANFVTKTNLDDGIYYACKHFGWID